MKPEDLLDPDNLPPELEWVVEHYRLQPNDPVFILIAWHWKTAQEAESKLANVAMEMKAALDSRAKVLMESADAIAKVGEQIAQVKSALEAKPLGLAKRLERELVAPVVAAVAMVKAAEDSLTRAVRIVQSAQRRQTMAAFVIGMVFGASLLVWLSLP